MNLALQAQARRFASKPRRNEGANRERLSGQWVLIDTIMLVIGSRNTDSNGHYLIDPGTVAGWYKIRLPLDGKEGFLAQEKAKVMK
ncbi:hypothetical protein HUU05_08815 [candidate division KSB1 bacterium]|nr:hypothetical protein [candidate division KSB1 bacterium]